MRPTSARFEGTPPAAGQGRGEPSNSPAPPASARRSATARRRAPSPGPEATLSDFEVDGVDDGPDLLGKGSFGAVRRARRKGTEYVYALKTICKRDVVEGNLIEQVEQEISVQSQLKHENVLRLHCHFEDHHTVYLLLEYCSKGELYKLLRTQRGRRFPESMARHFFVQVARGLQYLHSKGIVHRDLKPENLLVNDEDVLKIADFGWCAMAGIVRSTFCGTLDYMAPEMIQGRGHTRNLDLWSLGVLLYEMVVGKPPFQSTNHVLLVSRILSRDLRFPTSMPQRVADVCSWLLQSQPEDRMTLEKVLAHSWVKNSAEASADLAPQPPQMPAAAAAQFCEVGNVAPPQQSASAQVTVRPTPSFMPPQAQVILEPTTFAAAAPRRSASLRDSGSAHVSELLSDTISSTIRAVSQPQSSLPLRPDPGSPPRAASQPQAPLPPPRFMVVKAPKVQGSPEERPDTGSPLRVSPVVSPTGTPTLPEFRPAAFVSPLPRGVMTSPTPPMAGLPPSLHQTPAGVATEPSRAVPTITATVRRTAMPAGVASDCGAPTAVLPGTAANLGCAPATAYSMAPAGHGPEMQGSPWRLRSRSPFAATVVASPSQARRPTIATGSPPRMLLKASSLSSPQRGQIVQVRGPEAAPAGTVVVPAIAPGQPLAVPVSGGQLPAMCDRQLPRSARAGPLHRGSVLLVPASRSVTPTEDGQRRGSLVLVQTARGLSPPEGSQGRASLLRSEVRSATPPEGAQRASLVRMGIRGASPLEGNQGSAAVGGATVVQAVGSASVMQTPRRGSYLQSGLRSKTPPG